MPEREVRYCTTEDGVRIAYCMEGEGPALMVCPGFESFSLSSLMPEVESFNGRIGAGRTLVFYDTRGIGLSERGVEDLSLDALVSDMHAVADAAGLERLAIWAPALSGTKSIKYAAQNPARVSALVLYGTFARVLDAFTLQALKAFEALALSDWELFCRTTSDMGAARAEAGDAPLRAASVAAQSGDGQTMARFIRLNVDVDVTPCLTAISARTLVIHRIAHSIFPVALGQALATGIPGARLITPPGAIAAYMWGDVKPITDAINAFLDEDPETRPIATAKPARLSESAFRAVLFTDLVGHTEMMSRLGDERGRAVLREHETITRKVLKQHAGTEIKTMGDGFMASFGSVTKAVECAVALQRAFDARNRGQTVDRGVGVEQLPDGVSSSDEGVAVAQPLRASESAQPPVEPLHVRVGLNAGEPIEEEGDLFGATVILASRIAAKADRGEVLVSDNVRSLCSGKGFLFADRGEFAAKGFEDPVHIYEVNWQT